MNRLASEKSPYLKHAANQPVNWLPWSEEAFELARRENKPVFLSIGAVWCHWCHVMAKESFESEETARLLNESFISVKLDRDERPDIDRRYQQAVAAMGGGSGWPLTVFLTPDKKPFYGGTYFPPVDRRNVPAFRNVLGAISEFYRTRRNEAEDMAGRVREALQPEVPERSDLREAQLEEAEAVMVQASDPVHGGFGGAPKFPMPGALEFLLRRPGQTPPVNHARLAGRRMLDAMLRGGLHDHLGGGFHRYATDAAWIVPHFEKMTDDNAGLLRNFTDGFALFGDRRYRDAAAGILAYTREILSDPAGGFYASQDADVTPDDEGGYFTWTGDEFRKTLDREEFMLLSAAYLHDAGRMHHDPEKHVLYLEQDIPAVAEKLGMPPERAGHLLASGRAKLLRARSARPAPFIDKTLYTSLNGMMISAYFRAAGVLRDEAARVFAVASLERVLRERLPAAGLLHADGVPALLDDYVHLADALVSAYEAGSGQRYLDLADTIMTACLDSHYDPENGGFFDTKTDLLGVRMKMIEDVPHPSANAVAITLLLKLDELTGRDAYRSAAERSLQFFAEPVADMGVHAGSYYCGLDAWFRMTTFTVEARPESALAAAVRTAGARSPVAIAYGPDNNRVISCRQGVCEAPLTDPGAIEALYR